MNPDHRFTSRSPGLVYAHTGRAENAWKPAPWPSRPESGWSGNGGGGSRDAFGLRRGPGGQWWTARAVRTSGHWVTTSGRPHLEIPEIHDHWPGSRHYGLIHPPHTPKVRVAPHPSDTLNSTGNAPGTTTQPSPSHESLTWRAAFTHDAAPKDTAWSSTPTAPPSASASGTPPPPPVHPRHSSVSCSTPRLPGCAPPRARPASTPARSSYPSYPPTAPTCTNGRSHCALGAARYRHLRHPFPGILQQPVGPVSGMQEGLMGRATSGTRSQPDLIIAR